MQNEALEVGAKIGRAFLRAEPHLTRISGPGSCNEVFLAAAGYEQIIIRLNADRDGGEFRKEQWSMGQAALTNVRVPTSLGWGIESGWNYSIQSFEGSVNGTDSKDQLAIWRWLGKMASRFNKVRVEGFGGTLADEESGRFSGDWGKYISDNLNSVTQEDFGFTRTQASELRRRFEHLAGKTFRLGLCHGDLKPANVVIDERGNTLIDWGCAHAHVVPHYDFLELLRDHAADGPEVAAFADGYGLTDQMETLMDEIQSVLLMCSFDLVRWARDCAPSELPRTQKGLDLFSRRFQVI